MSELSFNIPFHLVVCALNVSQLYILSVLAALVMYIIDCFNNISNIYIVHHISSIIVLSSILYFDIENISAYSNILFYFDLSAIYVNLYVTIPKTIVTRLAFILSYVYIRGYRIPLLIYNDTNIPIYFKWCGYAFCILSMLWIYKSTLKLYKCLKHKII